MSKREYRRFTAEQKLEVLKSAEQPGVTISEVCPKSGLSPAQFYRWRAVAQCGSASALKNEARGAKPASQTDVDRRDAELVRLLAMIAEITAENLKLKKRSEDGRPGSGIGAAEGGSVGMGSQDTAASTRRHARDIQDCSPALLGIDSVPESEKGAFTFRSLREAFPAEAAALNVPNERPPAVCRYQVSATSNLVTTTTGVRPGAASRCSR